MTKAFIQNLKSLGFSISILDRISAIYINENCDLAVGSTYWTLKINDLKYLCENFRLF
jgi:hypothetical protein